MNQKLPLLDTLDLEQLKPEVAKFNKLLGWIPYFWLISLAPTVALLFITSILISTGILSDNSPLVLIFINSSLPLLGGIAGILFAPQLAIQLSYLKRLNQQPLLKQPFRRRQIIEQIVPYPLVTAGIIFLFIILPALEQILPENKVIRFVVAFAPLLLIIFFILSVIRRRQQMDMSQAYNNLRFQGEFTLARQQVNQLRQAKPSNLIFQNWHCTLLLWEGQLEECLTTQAELIQQAEAQAHQEALVVSWINQGHMLIWAERYTESIPYLEAGIRTYLNVPAAYIDLARVYLLQNINPERALALLQFVRDINKTQSPLLDIQLLELDAQQQINPDTDINTSLTTLIEQIDGLIKEDIPESVRLYYHAGLLYRRLQETEAAQNCFQKIYDLNPQGVIGQAAKRQLATLV